MLRFATVTFVVLFCAMGASAQDAGASGSVSSGGGGSFSARGGGGTRLALQGRIPLAALAWGDGTGGGRIDFDPGPGLGGIGAPDATSLMVPMITPGARILDEKLFIGLGLGFSGWSYEDGDNEASRNAWSLSPMANYDVIGDDSGALSVGGTLNLIGLGETEVCNGGNCQDANDDAFGVGLNLMAGIRGKLGSGLAIGAEFGWGILSVGADQGGDSLYHGFIGSLLVEGSVGI